MDVKPLLDRSGIEAVWHDNPYYKRAEEWLSTFWGEGSPYLAQFRQLDLTAVVELACGHGRHSGQILRQTGSLTLVDLVESNLDACRARFAGEPHLRFIRNAGNDLPGIADGSQTAIFCYDAMVHFELLDVLAYLREARRVLVPGGRALLHVSNNADNPEGSFDQHHHWRSFGGVDVIRHFASRVGLRVLSHQLMDWGDDRALDGLLLLESPAGG